MVQMKHVTLLVALTVFAAPGFGDRASAQAFVVKVKPGEAILPQPAIGERSN